MNKITLQQLSDSTNIKLPLFCITLEYIDGYLHGIFNFALNRVVYDRPCGNTEVDKEKARRLLELLFLSGDILQDTFTNAITFIDNYFDEKDTNF